MVQGGVVRAADIHAGAAADGLQALQDLDILGRVFLGSAPLLSKRSLKALPTPGLVNHGGAMSGPAGQGGQCGERAGYWRKRRARPAGARGVCPVCGAAYSPWRWMSWVRMPPAPWHDQPVLMGEGVAGVVIARAPVVLHGKAAEFVVLGVALIGFLLVDQLHDVDFGQAREVGFLLALFVGEFFVRDQGEGFVEGLFEPVGFAGNGRWWCGCGRSTGCPSGGRGLPACRAGCRRWRRTGRPGRPACSGRRNCPADAAAGCWRPGRHPSNNAGRCAPWARPGAGRRWP